MILLHVLVCAIELILLDLLLDFRHKGFPDDVELATSMGIADLIL